MRKSYFLLILFFICYSFINKSWAQAPTINSVQNLNNESWINVSPPVNSLGGINTYQYSLDNGSTWITPSPLATESPVKITGLTNCNTYSVKIRANQWYGNSAASSAVTVQPKASVLNTSNDFTMQVPAEFYFWNSIAYGNGLFVAVASNGFGNRVMTSPDGVTWTSQTAPDQPWKTITYGNGTFVALANSNSGAAMTSPDGINWTQQTVGYCEWECVTFGSGIFVAVASSGYPKVMYSSDGINWNQSNEAGYESWKSVTYGDGKFVAVADFGSTYSSMTSTDGINWTGNAAIQNDWKSVTYGAGKFVAVNASGTNRVMTSIDGTTWTSTASSVADNGTWSSITFGNGIFVAVAQYGNNKIMWSLDGVSWFLKNEPANDNWQCVTFGNGSFVAVANYGSYQGQLMTNTMSFSAPPDAPVITSAANIGSNTSVYFAAPNDRGTSFINSYEYSIDNGVNWVAPSTPITSSPFIINGLSSGGVRLRAISSAGTSCPSAKVMLSFVPGVPTIDSTDGINGGAMVYFTPPASDGGATIYNYEYSVDNGATWVTPSPAVTSSPLIFTGALPNCTTGSVKIRAVNISGPGTASAPASVSPVASQFTAGTFIKRTTSFSNANWASTVFGKGIFVAVGNGVMTSPDGINWTQRTPANANRWQSVAFGNGIFVAVASSGTGSRIMTSPDGITWTAQTAPVTRSWTGIAFGNGTFVATADGRSQPSSYQCFIYSTNGINWTLSSGGGDIHNWNIKFVNGQFFAFGVDQVNFYKTSSNGTNWTNVSLPYSLYSNDVIYANGKYFLLAGQYINGIVYDYFSSTDGINWTEKRISNNPNGSSSFLSIAYANGNYVATYYVAAGSVYSVFKSTDGNSWSEIPISNYSSPNGVYENFGGLSYGNGRFVAVSGGNGYPVMTSNLITKSTPTPVITSITPYHTACFVNFTVATSAYAEPATNYQYSLNNGATWTTMNPAVTTSPFKISGLTNGTTYNIKIRSVNLGGNSCPSNSVSVTPVIGVGAGAPVIDSVQNRDNSALVYFTPPASDGGSPMTNYQYSVDSGLTWLTRSPVSTLSPLTISGISNCSRYPVFIRALNASGSGVNSNLGVASPISTSFVIPTSWTASTGPTINGNINFNGLPYWRDITYGNGLFVVVGNQGTIADKVLTSNDGVNWTKRTAAANIGWTKIAFGNGTFVAKSSDGNNGFNMMKSTNGIDWTYSQSPFNAPHAVVFASGKFVACGTTPQSATTVVFNSADGINWTQVLTANKIYYDLVYCKNMFIASNIVNNNYIFQGIMMTSPDGITWTEQNNSSIRDMGPTYITYGAGKFVAHAQGDLGGAKLLYSTDGINWTPSAQSDNNIMGITYGNGMFIAQGSYNTQYSSIDGVNWTSTSLSTSNSITSLRFLNGKFFMLNDKRYYASTGENSTSSDVLSFADGGIFQTPNAPTINTITTSGGNGSIDFAAPSSNGGQPITNYEYSVDNGNTWVTPSPEVITSPLVIPDTLGDIRIRAVNSIGSGCPSSLFQILDCYPSYSTTNITTCSSQLPYSWNGNNYNVAGTYVDTLVNADGCDSIATLNLTINQPTSSSVTITSCNSYQWKGNTYTTSGNYTWTGTNAAGCDSVVILHLTVNYSSTSTTNQSICNNQIPYSWNGNTYGAAGIYSFTTTNAAGCDSVATLVLTVKNTSSSTTNISRCSNQMPYLWNGNSYGTAGTYSVTLTNAAGCDSVATLVLTVKNTSSSTTNVSRCSNQFPYTWNGNNYSAAGTYSITLTNAVGCDSVATLFLSVKQTTSSTTNVSAAGSYTWNGNTYTVNGTYTWTGTNAAGCDSVATLVFANTATNISNVCPYIGTNSVLIYTASVSGASSYNWVMPANTQLISGQGTRSIQIKILNGFQNVNNKQLKVTPSGGTQQIIYLLAQAPVTPAGITASSSNICTILGTNNAITYTIPKAYAAVSYIWTAQNGTTNITSLNGNGVNDTAVAVTFTSNFTSSNITVQSVNDCGVSGSRSLMITRNTPSQPGLISGPTNACEYAGETAQTATYFVPAVADSYSYSWTLPNGALAVTGQGTRSISFKYPTNFTGGTISVTATNGCGTGGARSLAISRLQAGAPGVIDVINTGGCPNRIYTYTIASIPSNATSVLWTVPAGGTIVSGQGTASITVSYNSGLVSGEVKARAVNNCSVSANRETKVKLPACPVMGFAGNRGNLATPVQEMSFITFPNPSTASFNLRVKSTDGKELSARILDVQGRMIRALTIVPYETIQFGNELKAGVYMVEVKQGNVVKKTRVVKY